MIVSRAHRFVFFHNPKAGGTSVRASIEAFNDIGFGLWGADPDQTAGVRVDRAHLGVDEFARHFPQLWEQSRDFARFSLRRDPTARFLSSVAEHAKLHGPVDVRFCPPAQRNAVLWAMIDRLSGFGRAEAPELMQAYELTHFKPQWIYWQSEQPGVSVQSFPVERMAEMFDAIAALTGVPPQAETRNTREQLDLPGPLARLAASARVKAAVAALPGAGALRAGLRRRYAAAPPPQGGFELGPEERARVETFVRGFYAEDLARWPA